MAGVDGLGRRKTSRDVAQTGRGALVVVNDVLPPWQARAVDGGSGGEIGRVFPERIVGRGIDPDAPGSDVGSVSG